jgi:putative peptide zinc metalloprotease protein
VTATAPSPDTDWTTLDRPPGHLPRGATVCVDSLDRADGLELLGAVQGSGYKEGAALVRRADGQIVQVGPFMYGLLESMDGRRTAAALAESLSVRLDRTVEEAHVGRLAEKLAQQGLLAGFEHLAPPRRNPLLAMRWKVMVTNPRLTRRLTTPFAFLFRPWVMWPVCVAFVAVFWFVLIHKGVASATTDAFHSPGLLLLVFALSVLSSGFHEFGHAAACRYGGATPGGMGMGLYLVFPAFYTDVTDAYRLPRRDRLRIDLAGLYFNALVAVHTMVVWLCWRIDALLLLVALQILQMVKQLSPVIRADGYHILSDATGVPDLYAHIGPTLRTLLPGRRRSASALTGRARLLVTVWVLIVVPVLVSLLLGAVLLLPHLAASAWDSGRLIARAIPHEASDFQVVKLLASVFSLFALALPVAASALVTQKSVRLTLRKARAWSAGRPRRRVIVAGTGAIIVALLAWAWWPSGQYQPVHARHGGTIPDLTRLISSPQSATGGTPIGTRQPPASAPIQLSPGTHLAAAMIPAGGISRTRPAFFFVAGFENRPPAAILTSGPVLKSEPIQATFFPFVLPSPPGPGGTQALALNTKDGTVVYNVAYALVTVSGGAAVSNTNSAFAIAHCQRCTTVAVSFQIVLVIGHSNTIAPTDAAGALNDGCVTCTTTAIADQMVITLESQPSQTLISELEASLQQLDDLSRLGAGGTPSAIAAAVTAIHDQVVAELQTGGLLSGQPGTSTTVAGSTTTGTSGSAGTGLQPTGPAPTVGSTSATTTTGSSSPSSVPEPTAPSTSPSSTTAPSSSTTDSTTDTTPPSTDSGATTATTAP